MKCIKRFSLVKFLKKMIIYLFIYLFIFGLCGNWVNLIIEINAESTFQKDSSWSWSVTFGPFQTIVFFSIIRNPSHQIAINSQPLVQFTWHVFALHTSCECCLQGVSRLTVRCRSPEYVDLIRRIFQAVTISSVRWRQLDLARPWCVRRHPPPRTGLTQSEEPGRSSSSRGVRWTVRWLGKEILAVDHETLLWLAQRQRLEGTVLLYCNCCCLSNVFEILLAFYSF